MAKDLLSGEVNTRNWSRSSSLPTSTNLGSSYGEELVARIRAAEAANQEPTDEQIHEVNKLARLGDPSAVKLIDEWHARNPGLSPKAKHQLLMVGAGIVGIYALTKLTDKRK